MEAGSSLNQLQVSSWTVDVVGGLSGEGRAEARRLLLSLVPAACTLIIVLDIVSKLFDISRYRNSIPCSAFALHHLAFPFFSNAEIERKVPTCRISPPDSLYFALFYIVSNTIVVQQYRHRLSCRARVSFDIQHYKVFRAAFRLKKSETNVRFFYA